MRIKWTDSEIKSLIKNYPILSDIQLMNAYPYRTLASIKVKAKKIGLYKTKDAERMNRSNAIKGEKNGMFGKIGSRKGVIVSNETKEKLSKACKGKTGLKGNKNPRYGKPAVNKGKKMDRAFGLEISKIKREAWKNLNENEKNKKRNQLLSVRNNFLLKKLPSLPELKIKSYLDQIDRKYDFQLKIGKYVCDFSLDNKIILEVQGDYWHGNPLKYDKLDQIQIKNVKRDIRKNKFLNQLGYRIIYLWEYDIKRDFEKCKKIINEIN
jgi:G:T-mismatch repair DNA endonuclease (very short patch repair protein)